MKKKLAVLGCGNMGSAIALGLNHSPEKPELCFYDPTAEKSEALAEQTGGKSVPTVANLKDCDIFLIACKPQQFPDLSKELKTIVTTDSVVVSVMAGISTQTITAALGSRKISRVMPNTPCLIREGVAAIYFTEALTATEKKIVENFFKPIAKIFICASDKEIDIVTALTGSGPAYIFEIARIFADKAAQLGLNSDDSQSMTKQLIHGAAQLMLQSKDSLKSGSIDVAIRSTSARLNSRVLNIGLSFCHTERGR